MDFVEIIINLIIGSIVLFMACGIIWNTTKIFGLKGFFISTCIFLSLIIIPIGFEKFFEYSYENKPILIIIFLAILALIVIGIIIYSIIESYKAAGENKKKFIKDTINGLKILLFSILIGAAIVGTIVFLLIASDI